MSTLIHILKHIVKHPLASKKKFFAMRRFAGWQLSQAIFRHPVVYTLVENSVMVIQKGMTGATGNIYTGLLEFTEMAFVLHVVRENDVFADIGANVGVYSILASVNAGAKTIAIEPIPQTFGYLQRNVRVNNAGNKIITRQMGVGDKTGELLFTSGMDTVNHVMSVEEKTMGLPAVKVDVDTIDEIFRNDCPVLLKIDVEGFEWPALQGAGNTIGDDRLKAIIIEINGSGGRYGIKDEDVHRFFLNKGFTPYKYEPFSRMLTSLTSYGDHNTIYIRDLEWVRQRLLSSRKYEIFGISI